MQRSFIALAALMTAVLTPAHATAGRSMVIGLPEDFAGSPQDLKEQAGRVFLSLKAGSSATFVALPSQKTIARVTLPDLPRFDNLNIRLRMVQPAARQVEAFIDHAATVKPVTAALPSQVLLAISLDAMAENLAAGSGSREVLIVGSAEHDDRREPSFSMKGSRWFGDGLINGSGSVYGTATRHGQLAGVGVHLCVTEQPSDWSSPMSAAHIERAWSLFVQEQGGTLSTFTPNLATCFDRLLRGGVPPTRTYEVNKNDHRLVMLSQEPDRQALDIKNAPAARPGILLSHGPHKRRMPQPAAGPGDIGAQVIHAQPAHAPVHASKIRLGTKSLPQPCAATPGAPAEPMRARRVDRPRPPASLITPGTTALAIRTENARSTVTPSITRRDSIALGAHPGTREDETCLN